MPPPFDSRRPVRGLYVLLAALSTLLALAVFAPSAYRVLVREDGPVEWLTAVGLLATALALGVRYRERARYRPRTWRIVVGAAAAAALFGCAEEISWGQRMVGYEVAEGSLLAQYNAQGELNLHNLSVGGVKLNKVIFTWALGAVLFAYFVVYPLATRGRGALRARLLHDWGIPTPDGESVVVAGLCAVVAQAIPLSRSSEAFELILPAVALVTVLQWRGGESGDAATVGRARGRSRVGFTPPPVAAGSGSASSA